MASDWNTGIECVIAADLTLAEQTLALALMRLTLGYRQPKKQIGVRYLRETAANMDGRDLERARAGLVEKGLLEYTPGRVGRGGRSTYRLILDQPEKTVPDRSFPDPEKTGVDRSNGEAEKTGVDRSMTKGINDRSHVAKKTGVDQSRRGKGKGKDIPAPAAPHDDQDENDIGAIIERAQNVYIAAGGNLDSEGALGALQRFVSKAIKDGIPITTILVACRDIGSKGEFTGLLKQRIADFHANGLPCKHGARDIQMLTAAQQLECGCKLCTEYHQAGAHRDAAQNGSNGTATDEQAVVAAEPEVNNWPDDVP